jgi:hypothetical protein
LRAGWVVGQRLCHDFGVIDDEEPSAENATVGLVRVGDTVRRPAGPWSDAVDAVLEHLRVVGFTGAPRPLGRDELGRQVLGYVHGEVGADSGSIRRGSCFRSVGC